MFPAGAIGCWAGRYSEEKGNSVLYFLDKNATMNNNSYVVLNGHMLPFYRDHDNAYFLQDGAPCHKAGKVKE